jgi:hypothetical protein
MARLALLIAGLVGGWMLWEEVQVDDRILWAALIPTVYLVGMWSIMDGQS